MNLDSVVFLGENNAEPKSSTDGFCSVYSSIPNTTESIGLVNLDTFCVMLLTGDPPIEGTLGRMN
jgi:hypothetical protein